MLSYNLNENFNMPSYLVAISKIIKCLRKIPTDDYDLKFYRLLIETLVLFAPVVPHVTSECWARLKQAASTKNYLDNVIEIKNEMPFDFEKQIIEQNWPRMDADWPLGLTMKIDGKRVLKMNIDQDTLSGGSNGDEKLT